MRQRFYYRRLSVITRPFIKHKDSEDTKAGKDGISELKNCETR
jgi:hypothetical protein